MTAPVETTQVKDIGGIAELNVNVSTWPLQVKLDIEETVVAVPAGRWLVEILVHATGCVGEKPILHSFDETLGAPGTIEIPATVFRCFRSIDKGDQRATVTLEVSEWVTDAFVRRAIGTMYVDVPEAPGPATTEFGLHAISILNDLTDDNVEVQRRMDFIGDDLEDAGGNWIRCSFRWSLLQPTSAGVWDETIASKLDILHAKCVAKGFDIVAILGVVPGPPGWATDGNGYPVQSSLNTYMSQFFSRYPAVKAVEPANEPDLNNIDPEDYAIPHGRVYSAVKAVAPAVTVLFGAFAHANTHYIGQCLDEGVSSFDAVSIHPYPVRFPPTGTTPYLPNIEWGNPRVPWEQGDPEDAVNGDPSEYMMVSGVYSLDAFLRDRGFTNKKIWVTEYGLAYEAMGPGVGKGRMSPVKGAGHLAYGMRQAARMSEVPVFIIHEGMSPDAQSTEAWLDGFGLRMHSGGPRPALAAFVDASSNP